MTRLRWATGVVAVLAVVAIAVIAVKGDDGGSGDGSDTYGFDASDEFTTIGEPIDPDDFDPYEDDPSDVDTFEFDPDEFERCIDEREEIEAAIDDHFADRGEYPGSIEELLGEDYLATEPEFEWTIDSFEHQGEPVYELFNYDFTC